MGVFEIISAIVLIVACVFIVVVVLMKDTKTQMSQTISGTTADSFYQKNAGRTKEAILNKATIAAAIIFFVLALAVNVINIASSKSRDAADDGTSVGIAEDIESAAVSDSESGATDGESGAESDAADSAVSTDGTESAESGGDTVSSNE